MRRLPGACYDESPAVRSARERSVQSPVCRACLRMRSWSLIKERIRMKHVTLIAVALAFFCTMPRSVGAQTDTAVSDGPTHYNGGLGFHSIDAPLGGRYWFMDQKV